MKPIKRVLIANRGEIAVRIARTLRELEITSVAVYSAADKKAMHVWACDEAYYLGPAQASQSYLSPQAYLAVAKAAQVDAIHPGYGFLSENAAFAEMVLEHGFLWIGPPPPAIVVMGSKTAARAAMQKAQVPVVPGSDGSLQGIEQTALVAKRLGYPVMLKASAGGGGKGIRLVASCQELSGALRGAMSEAQNAFGDAAVYLEKAIIKPKHVEIQVVCDAHGNAVYVGERECSMQRRHQKVLEESPSNVVDDALRAHMGQLACQAAQAVGYRGLGTVEFLLDQNRDVYFLEMNTRLQVEHPVTELCYGVDLVAAQILIAQGDPLPWSQEALQSRGFAIEARLYAEDPQNNFAPSPGRITHLRWPQGPHVRVDAGIDLGCEVSGYYDPMVAKIIAWAPTRQIACKRLLHALQEVQVGGIVTNLLFLQKLLQSPEFLSGDYHTGSVDTLCQTAAPVPSVTPEAQNLAMAVAAMVHLGNASNPNNSFIAAGVLQQQLAWQQQKPLLWDD